MNIFLVINHDQGLVEFVGSSKESVRVYLLNLFNHLFPDGCPDDPLVSSNYEDVIDRWSHMYHVSEQVVDKECDVSSL